MLCSCYQWRGRRTGWLLVSWLTALTRTATIMPASAAAIQRRLFGQSQMNSLLRVCVIVKQSSLRFILLNKTCRPTVKQKRQKQSSIIEQDRQGTERLPLMVDTYGCQGTRTTKCGNKILCLWQRKDVNFMPSCKYSYLIHIAETS